MLVVIDTNVFISALLSPSSSPARLLTLWQRGRFTLLSTTEQLDELNRVTRYPKLRHRLNPSLAGRLINELRSLSTLVAPLPEVSVSPDPYDNYLLAIALAGVADYLVTGDKRDLLSLKKYEGTNIITVAQFLDTYDRKS
ncbi:MAG: putative toxin-antitoxin system toxin component, PIN family [Nitrospira sp. WS110]|nr:putative toxin-antitoxin system toxin component, PIN family [Nitrospira sp. WS110]